MKNTLILIIGAVVLSVVPAAAQKVEKPVKVFWDGATIPDPIFRKYVLDNFDTNQDGLISKEEAEAVKEIDVSPNPKPTKEAYESEDFEYVTSLAGMEYFINLHKLNCSYTKISALSLTYTTGKKKDIKTHWLPLVELDCKMTLIKELHCNEALEKLIAGGAGREWLAPLERVKTYGKKLKYVNVSCSELVEFNSNEIKNEPDLETFYFPDTKLPKLSIENCGKLKKIDSTGNTQLSSLHINNCGKLEKIFCMRHENISSLHVNNCEKLEEINACDLRKDNKLIMTVSNLPALKVLWVIGNKLDSLDLSTLPLLEKLYCDNNNLTRLDLSKNPKLQTLSCENNQLTQLDLSNYPAVTDLQCYDNPLTFLDVSGLKIEHLSIPKGFYFRDLRYNEVTSFPDYVRLSSYETISNFNIQLREYENKVREWKEEEEERIAELIKQNEEEESERLAAAQAEREKAGAEYKKQLIPYMQRRDWNEVLRIAREAESKMGSYGTAYIYFAEAKAYYYLHLDINIDENDDATPYYKAYSSEAQRLRGLCNLSISLDNSSNNEAYFYRGVACLMLFEPDNAVSDFKTAMAGHPELRSDCNYNIGTAYSNAKRYAEAIPYFKNAHSYYTNTKMKEKSLSRVKLCQERAGNYYY